jgi:ribonuclease E
MTFYEAALRVLESEGRPLHFLEITERSIAQNLLSHVGKTPELTMLSRLAAMARRTRDRKVIVTAKDTFALTDWSLPEDAEALAHTGVMEAHPEEGLAPLRPTERHPDPRTDNVRVAGRGSERKQRRQDEEDGRGGRRRRFPPMPEVVFEILSEADQSLRPEQLLEQARTKELAAEDATVESLLTALLEDNQRRIDAGRRPQFSFSTETGAVTLERAGSPSEAPPLELQAAFAAALGIPLQDGRPVLNRPGAAPVAAPEALADAALLTAARAAVKDARKAVARSLRKRLGELDVGTFEKSVVKMMHALGFRELKVAKRSKEGPLLTARKREGSVDLRYAIRMLKGVPALDRKAVQELRKDLGHYAAQVGLLACAGEARGDARTEAQASGSLVMLWCGDALGEKFLEARSAVSVTTVELFDVDERFFEVAKLEAEEAQKRREERQREKLARADEGDEAGEDAPARGAMSVEIADDSQKRREERREERQRERDARREDRREERRRERKAAQKDEPGAESPPVVASPVVAPSAPAGLSEEDEGDEEGEDEDLEAASAFVAGAPGEAGSAEESASSSERKRRRRRRRGRRGRGGRGPEGEPGAAVPAEGAVVAVTITEAIVETTTVETTTVETTTQETTLVAVTAVEEAPTEGLPAPIEAVEALAEGVPPAEHSAPVAASPEEPKPQQEPGPSSSNDGSPEGGTA